MVVQCDARGNRALPTASTGTCVSRNFVGQPGLTAGLAARYSNSMPNWYFECLSAAHRRFPPETRRAIVSTACLAALALGFAFTFTFAFSGWANAAGLGRINVLSRLGQPFAAEIEVINVSRDDFNTLTVKLAPSVAYQAANITFDSSLNSLRLSVQRRADGTPFIRAASWRPVVEPYLDLLIDVGSNDGGFRRHYAVLLDLPGASDAVTAPAAAALAAGADTKAPANPADPTAPRKTSERRTRKPAASTTPATPPAPPATQAATPAAATAPVKAASRSPASPAAAKTSALKLDTTFFEPPGALAKAEPTRADPPKVETAATAVTGNTPPAAPAPAPVAAATVPAAQPSPEPQAAAPKRGTLPAPRPQQATPSPSSGKDSAAPSLLKIAGIVLGLAAVAGGLWAGFAAWRRRQAEVEEETYTFMNAAAEPSTGNESADASNPQPVAAATATNAFPDGDAPAAAHTVSSVTDAVDPLDEAKVYMSYDQLDQAEKVLRDAMSKAPGREDIMVTLLEVYAVQGDKDGFNQVAARLHRQTGGIGDNWKRVAVLGYAIDPSHPLYSPPADAANGNDLTFDVTQGGESGARAISATHTPVDISVESNEYGALKRLGIEPVQVAPAAPAFTLELPPEDAAVRVKGAGAGLVDPGVGLDFSVDLPEANAQPPTGPDLTTVRGDTTVDFKLDTADGDKKADTDAAAAFWDGAITTPPRDRTGKDQGPTVRPWQVAPRDEKWEAVQEKFELAEAYIAMNDHAAAKEVLNEIDAEGDAGQKAEAARLLLTIA